MKFLSKAAITLMFSVLACFNANAIGWPANYQGVMLQGFYWDSYDETKWTNLSSQASELSHYFSLIWIPNAAQSAGYPSMGYCPIYWFSNYNSSFGSEAELRNMVKLFRSKGTGIIGDVVVNHRSGVSNWYDFPSETWNGKTYKMGLSCICRNDEMAYDSSQPNPTGAYDTGDNFDGSRDLDHTNSTVQSHCKDYTRFLLQDLGYVGFRWDMVKGFSAQYVKMYNQASGPSFSVGEYWDGYDNIANWIDGTDWESGAFDFPFKYAVNEAFGSGDMTKLAWAANGDVNNYQPAGLIHYNYRQLAVTFIDNHDTYGDGSKFTGNVVAAHAFMLCSPGTPCVLLRHWLDHKDAIARLISIRNSVGVTNTSTVRVLRLEGDCYMAEVTGKNGKLVVKIGSSMTSPDGYSNSDIVATGNDYCVWTKVPVADNYKAEKPVTPTGNYTVYYDNSVTNWTHPRCYYYGANAAIWPGEKMIYVKDNIWKCTVPAGNNKVIFNGILNNEAGVVGQNQTADLSGSVNGLYNITGFDGSFDGPQGLGPEYWPKYIFMVGNIEGNHWHTSSPLAAHAYTEGVYIWRNVSFEYSEPPTAPVSRASTVTVYFDNTDAKWTTPYIYYWGGPSPSWPGVKMTKVSANIWKYDCPAGTTGVLFNAGNGDATKTGDFDALDGHRYNQTTDLGAYDPTATVTIYFDNSGSKWSKPHIYYWGGESPAWPGTEMNHVKGDVWSYTCSAGTTGVLFNAGDGDASKTQDFVAVDRHIYSTSADKGSYTPPALPAGYVTFVTAFDDNDGEWTGVNTADRFGALEEDAPLTVGVPVSVQRYVGNKDAASARSWGFMVPGNYTAVLDLPNMSLTLYNPEDAPYQNVTALKTLTGDDADINLFPVRYFDLQGHEVAHPQHGLYIRVQGTHAEKVIIMN